MAKAMIVAKIKGGPPVVHIPIPEKLDLDGKEDGDEVDILLHARIEKGTLVPMTLDGVPAEHESQEEAEAEAENPGLEDEESPEKQAEEEAPGKSKNFTDEISNMLFNGGKAG